MLETEKPGQTPHLDLLEPLELVQTFLQDQAKAAQAVWEVRQTLALAVEATARRLEAGGRLLYVGAGTSGRLALLDAAELPPTFSWPAARAVALLAGGNAAFIQALEGAEDDQQAALVDLQAQNPQPHDVVLCIAASGSTPYAVAALLEAKKRGLLTIGVSNNPDSALEREADFGICLNTGPEVISGSTRLKAGTAQKIFLSTFSSAVMVRLGKVHGNLMIDVKVSNIKLKHRAVHLVMQVAEVPEDVATVALELAQNRVALAVIMLKLDLSLEEAKTRLEAAGGRLRGVL